MATPLKLIAVATVALGAAGCAETVTRWNSEVGAQLDTGWFGAATMHNMLAQACGAQGYKGGQGKGTVVEPVVVLDPAHTKTRPIYRVHCDGQLNGKYARVIFDEYIVAAEPPPVFGIEVEASTE